MTMAKLPDPIWERTPKFMKDPLHVMTIMDPQEPTESQESEIIPGPKVFPVTIDFKLKKFKHLLLFQGFHGWLRHCDSIIKGSKPAHGTPESDAVRVNMDGTGGEISVSIATNRMYDWSIGTYRSIGDVDGDEVRTRSEDWMDLVIDREKDNLHRRFWLVIGRCPVYEVVGWTYGWYAAKHGGWIQMGHRGRAWGIKKSKLFNWMPQFDPCHHIKEQVQQQKLPFGAPPPARPPQPEPIDPIS